MTTYEPKIGDAVEDAKLRKFGRVTGFVGPYVQIRPIGGGREWDAKPEHLRPASHSQAMSAGVAAANERSRGQRL